MKKLILLATCMALIACQPKPEEGPDNVALVTKIYDAFSQGDIETVLAGLTDDVEWNEAENFIYHYGDPLIGKDAVVEGVFAKLGSEWEYWNLVDKSIRNVGDDAVLVTGRYQAKNKATGRLLDAQFAHVWTMRDTLASKFQQYTDTKQVEEVVDMDDDDDEMESETGMEESAD